MLLRVVQAQVFCFSCTRWVKMGIEIKQSVEENCAGPRTVKKHRAFDVAFLLLRKQAPGLGGGEELKRSAAVTAEDCAAANDS